jgi:hypothetical protein
MRSVGLSSVKANLTERLVSAVAVAVVAVVVVVVVHLFSVRVVSKLIAS